MKNVLLIAVALFMFGAYITSQAGVGTTTGTVAINGTDTEITNSFVGLWEAVDPNDGSHRILSITNNGGGTVKLLAYDSSFGDCNGGRGIVQGTGGISAEQSLKVDEFTIICFETSKSETFSSTFTLNSDGTLTEIDADESLAPAVIYHRTSQ